MNPTPPETGGPFWGLAPLVWLAGVAAGLVGLGWLWNWILK